jgi:CheY-like chemotaxis protein
VIVPTILVADDNSNIQKMVTLALKDLGMTVVAVGNGEAAVRKLPDLRPDLVLADIFMPVKNGYEVCEFMKNDERFAHIPVVLLVGAFDPLDENEVQRVHADGVLKKPFVPPDPLLSMITSLLEKVAPGGVSTTGTVLTAHAGKEAARPPGLEKTQQLTAAELAVATHQPAPEPEPEPEQFASQPPAIAIDDAHSPVAFQDMLEEPEEDEESDEHTDEEEEEAAEPAFEASSVSGIHLPGDMESPAGAAKEHVEDHWAGIKEVQKHPDPVEPPIPVQFDHSEPLEIVTDEVPEAHADVQVKQDPALVSSAHDWVSAPPAVEAKPHETIAEEVHEESKPLERIALDLHHERMRATPPIDEEETQTFSTPPTPEPPHIVPAPEPEQPEPAHVEEAHHEEPAPQAAVEAAPHSAWSRLEEAMIPAAPVIAAAAAEFHHAHETVAPHEAPAHAESQSPAPVPQSGTLGSDQMIAAITQKVMDQLDAPTIEKLSRELVRPLIEALIRREVDKE